MQDITTYISQSGDIQMQVKLQDNNAWLTQKQLAELFGAERSVITKHLQNIFETEELEENSVCAKIAQVQIEGNREVTREIAHYNLDAIISVGYRVNSAQATHFRKWATQILKDYLTKGYAINKELLKNDGDKVDGLAKITKELRAVEKTLYNKLKFILSNYSIDYDPNSETAKDFFSMCQNIIYYAVTRKTAAEILRSRAKSDSPNMGLQTWTKDRITLSDAGTAKNYLIDKELQVVESIINMFLDYANVQILVNRIHTMQDWVDKLVLLVRLNSLEVLIGKGNISSKIAKEHVRTQYDIYKGKYLA